MRKRKLAATVVGAAVAFTPAGLVMSGSLGGVASAQTTAAAGITTQIVLANGGYRYCLDDYRQGTTTGTKVVLWACNSSDPAQQWVFYSDDTIRPKVAPAEALGVSGNGDAVLESASAATASWSYRADGMVMNAAPTAAPAATEPALNDPAYRLGNGVQLIAYRQGSVTSNAHWWVKDAHYATTKLTDLPDAGLNGGFWALDTGTYQQSIIYTGNTGTSSNPIYTYEDSQVQAADFTTMPGTQQPNNTADPTAKIGDVLTGTMSGWYTSTLTSNQFVSATPPASVTGMSGWVELGPAHFFSTKATVTPGNKSGYFHYVSATDNCGNTETMTQTDTNGKPDNSTGWSGTGNIPAYAPSDANFAGGQTCPTS